jgi:hypothetical protein
MAKCSLKTQFDRPDRVFRGNWEGPIISTLITLAVLSTTAKTFWRAMLRKRRMVQNQLSTRPLEPGEKPPQPPAKYWERPWATDSPRGWAKIVTTLTLNALGLIILLTAAIAFLGRTAAGGCSDDL